MRASADTPLGGVPLSASLALLVAGAAMLARSPLLIALVDGERGQPAERLGAERLLAELETRRSSPAIEEADPSSSTTSTSPARIGR